jgi:hypothetical protein
MITVSPSGVGPTPRDDDLDAADFDPHDSDSDDEGLTALMSSPRRRPARPAPRSAESAEVQELRKVLTGHVVFRTLASLDFNGQPLVSLPPLTEVVLKGRLRGEEAEDTVHSNLNVMLPTVGLKLVF